MSGSQQIRVDRMNPCLFRHWITEWTEQNKLPSQILAEEVQDTDEIPDEFPTESNMEIKKDDDDEKKTLKRKFQITEKHAKILFRRCAVLEKEKKARELSDDKKRSAQDAHDSLVTYLVKKFNRYYTCVEDPQLKIFQTVYNNDGTVDEHIQRTPIGGI